MFTELKTWSKNPVILNDLIMIIISTHFHILETRAVHVRVEVLTALTVKITIFWDLMPCSPVDLYWHSRGMCCHHLQCRRANLFSSKMETPCSSGMLVKIASQVLHITFLLQTYDIKYKYTCMKWKESCSIFPLALFWLLHLCYILLCLIL